MCAGRGLAGGVSQRGCVDSGVFAPPSLPSSLPPQVASIDYSFPERQTAPEDNESGCSIVAVVKLRALRQPMPLLRGGTGDGSFELVPFGTVPGARQTRHQSQTAAHEFVVNLRKSELPDFLVLREHYRWVSVQNHHLNRNRRWSQNPVTRS